MEMYQNQDGKITSARETDQALFKVNLHKTWRYSVFHCFTYTHYECI